MNNFYQSLLNQRDPESEAIQQELMNQYNQSLAMREKSIAEAKDRAAKIEAQPVGMDQINLKPLVSVVDAWTGSNMAKDYQAPMGGQNRDLMLEKLRQAVGQQEAGLVDDRLNIARLMMEENRAKDGRAFKAMQFQNEADLKRELLRSKLEGQGGLNAQKDASKLAQGMDKREENILKTKESQKVQALINFKKALANYESLVDQKGINLTGADKDRMNSAYADLKIKYKEGANLGALTGPDVGIIVDAIAPATGVSGAARLAAAKLGFGGGVEGLKGGISQIKNNLESDFKTTQGTLEAAYGPNANVLQKYRSSFYGGGESASPMSAPSGPMVKVRFNGQVLDIPREDLESAIQDGAEVVK